MKKKLKAIIQQNWTVSMRKAQFHRKIHNALLNNTYQVSPILSKNNDVILRDSRFNMQAHHICFINRGEEI